MCFPAAAALMTFASTAMSAAGSVVGGMMQRNQANAQAAVDERQAKMLSMQGEYDAGQKQQQINQITGRQVAMANESGVTLAGSPTDIISSTAAQGALDVGAIRWGAKVKSDDLNYEAKLSRMQGQNAMAGGIMGGVGSVVGGLGKLGATPSPTAKNPNATYFGNIFGFS